MKFPSLWSLKFFTVIEKFPVSPDLFCSALLCCKVLYHKCDIWPSRYQSAASTIDNVGEGISDRAPCAVVGIANCTHNRKCPVLAVSVVKRVNSS